jgi:hypothetical protein
MRDAETWAKDEFGEGFFRLGNKFFFLKETDMMLFLMRWA